MKSKYAILPAFLLLMLLTAFAVDREISTIEEGTVALTKALDLAVSDHKAVIDAVGALTNKVTELRTRISALKDKGAPFDVRSQELRSQIETHNAHVPDQQCSSCVDAYNAERDKMGAEVASIQQGIDPLYADMNKLSIDILHFKQSLVFRDAIIQGKSNVIAFKNRTDYQLHLYADGHFGCTANPGMECTSTENGKARHLEAKLGEKTLIEHAITGDAAAWAVCADYPKQSACE